MSIDMYLSESRGQASSVYSMCRNQRACYQQLNQAIQKFVSAGELKGTAYGNAKQYFVSVLQPLSQGAELLSEMIAEACDNFPKQYVVMVDGSDLKESELEEQIARLNHLIQSLDSIENIVTNTASNPILMSYLLVRNSFLRNAYMKAKYELEQQLNKLKIFDSYSPSIFSEIAELQGFVEDGVKHTKTAWNAATGTFNLSGNLQWVTGISKIKAARKVELEVYLDSPHYGGDQGSPYSSYLKGDYRIADIIRKYYPDMSDKEIEDFLSKLNSEGCGYVALVNTFLNNYSGSELDFERKFGFPLYSVVDGEKVVNFDYLIVDLYASQDNHNKGFWFWEGDVFNPNEDTSNLEGVGTSQNSREYRFENYMDSYGVTVDVVNGEGFFNTKIQATVSNYEKYSAQGDIVISVEPVLLNDENGNGVVDMDGGHAMTVTGATADGMLIVSSWGKKYYLNPADYEGISKRSTFQVIKYA